MSNVTIETIRPAKTRIAGLWLVKVDGVIVGMLERYKNTRSTIHPWKAIAGHGLDANFLGAFYVEAEIFRADRRTDLRFGGREAALKAVLDAFGEAA
jgi:hypothetical protein